MGAITVKLDRTTLETKIHPPPYKSTASRT